MLALLEVCTGLVPVLPRSTRRPSHRVVPSALADVALSAALLSATPEVSTPPTSSIVLAKTETREGIYGTYEIQVPDRAESRDDARSTFKSRKETKKNRKPPSIFMIFL